MRSCRPGRRRAVGGRGLCQHLQGLHDAPEAGPALGGTCPTAVGEVDVPGRGTVGKLRPHAITNDGLKHLGVAGHKVVECHLQAEVFT